MFSPENFEHIEKVIKMPETKSGRIKHYGDIYQSRISGHKIYIAKRRNWNDVFRNGRKSVSEALRDEAAAWAIDKETWRKMKRLGIGLIGFRNNESGDCWFMRTVDFPKFSSPSHDYTGVGKGGSDQYCVKLEHFWFVPGVKKSLKR